MNPQGTLSQQVEAYHNWKKELIRQIGRYRLWLQDNNLFSEDVSTRIPVSYTHLTLPTKRIV